MSLKIYDVRGRLVRTLAEKQGFDAGSHKLDWDGRHANGENAGAGVFFYTLDAGGFRSSRRMVRLL